MSQFQKVKISEVPGFSQLSACFSQGFSYWTKCNLKPTFLSTSALQQEGNKGQYIHNKLVFSRESTIAKSNHTYQMPQITQSAQLILEANQILAFNKKMCKIMQLYYVSLLCYLELFSGACNIVGSFENIPFNLL